MIEPVLLRDPLLAPAPVLMIPDAFDDALCSALIADYDVNGGLTSGVMITRNGRTVEHHDPDHKRRRDGLITDPQLLEAIRERIRRCIAPAIHRAYAFGVTRMERYLVGCYDAAEGGHFRAHRDNTTPGTAHRRFAVSIHLNDDFEGGELSFPEYPATIFRATKGTAVVFSCSLLHQVAPVRRGRRLVFLSFLYDEAAAAIREANQRREAAADPA